MKKLEYLYFEFEGGRIPYIRKGKGTPLVLLIGFHSDIARFQYIISFLATKFEVIVPEYPGMGCEATLGGKSFTTQHYANVFIKFIDSLRIKSYILGGLCYGGIVALRMLKSGALPRKLLLIETFTKSSMLRPYWFQKPIIPVVKIAKNFRLARSFVWWCMKSTTFLTLFYKIIYRKEKNLKEILRYQMHLTTMMNPDVYIDAVDELLDFSLFQADDNWKIPVTSVVFEHDPLIDTASARREFKRVFKDLTILTVDYDDHIPSGPIDTHEAEKIFGPIKKHLVSSMKS